MRIAIPKERASGERRVLASPEVVKRLVRAGHEWVVERGAGLDAGFSDAEFEAAGARLGEGAAVLAGAHLVAQLSPPAPADLPAYPRGAVLVCFLAPAQRPQEVRALAEAGLSVFALDLIPRITRAQAMDALSSMSTVAGYRAALLAAQHLGKFFPMLMTAAGTIPPARVVVIGAGVAGLQAIATCRRLGAVVEAYDVRAEAREQARSLGAEAIEVDLGERGEGEGGYARSLSAEAQARLAARLAERVRAADAVITTALVPGRPAPCLVDAATVAAMKPGSVVVDLAAEAGGNCAGTRPGEVTRVGGVTVVGLLNLPATLPADASRMLARNLQEIVHHLTPRPPKAPGDAGAPPAAPPAPVALDLADEITAGALATHAGEVRHAPTRAALGLGATP